MEKKDKPARFTIDIPQNDHKRLKTLAAIHGQSMKDIVMKSIRLQLLELESKTKKDFFNQGI